MRNMNLKADQLRQVIDKLTRMMAQKDIQVTQRGVSAYCKFDPKTNKVVAINLPIIPPNPTEQFINAIHGYLDHEVAHALFTSPGEWKAEPTGSTEKVKRSAMRNNMINIVEDVRIENKMAGHFSGTLANMEATRRFVCDTIWGPALKKLGNPNHPMNRGKARTLALVAFLRAKGGHISCQQFIDAEGLEPLFEQLMSRVPDLEKQLLAMETTADAVKLADILIKAITPPPSEGQKKDKKEPEPQKPEKPAKPPKSSKEEKKDDKRGSEKEDGEGDDGDDDTSDGSESSDDDNSKGNDVSLAKALKHLTPAQRRALYLYNKKNKTVAEIATEMKTDEGTAMFNLKSARRRLSVIMGSN